MAASGNPGRKDTDHLKLCWSLAVIWLGIFLVSLLQQGSSTAAYLVGGSGADPGRLRGRARLAFLRLEGVRRVCADCRCRVVPARGVVASRPAFRSAITFIISRGPSRSGFPFP